MAGKRPGPSALAEPHEALGFYLDSLLTDLPPEEKGPVEQEATAAEKAPTPSATTAAFPGAPAKPATVVPPAPKAAAEPPVADLRPFAEPERTLPLLAAPSLFPQLRLDAPGAGTAEDAPGKSTAKAPCRETAPPSPPPLAEPAPRPAPPPVRREAPPMTSAAEETAPQPRRRRAAPQGAPDWAGDDFQCLTFTVAGLTLAAPLERLNGIVQWPGELTGLPGYADWFMGLLPNRGQNVRVIDTAQIVMPDGRMPDSRPVLERVRFVVLIDDGRWGLAADAIAQVLTLSRDGVRWRGEGGKRPWLAGTAVAQMCAVLDIDNLSEQLAEGLKVDA